MERQFRAQYRFSKDSKDLLPTPPKARLVNRLPAAKGTYYKLAGKMQSKPDEGMVLTGSKIGVEAGGKDGKKSGSRNVSPP